MKNRKLFNVFIVFLVTIMMATTFMLPMVQAKTDTAAETAQSGYSFHVDYNDDNTKAVIKGDDSTIFADLEIDDIIVNDQVIDLNDPQYEVSKNGIYEFEISFHDEEERNYREIVPITVSSLKESNSNEPMPLNVGEEFEQDSLYYRVISEDEVEIYNYYSNKEVGIKIPATVDYNSKTYKVVHFYHDIDHTGLYATNLASADFSEATNLTLIGDEALRNYRGTPLDFSNCVQLREIGVFAFRNVKVSELILPDGVEKIGRSAFETCRIPSINLPDSIQSIDNDAFAGATLTDLSLPADLETLEYSVFAYATLNSVDFSKCVKLQEIPSSLFSNASGITTVDLSKLTQLETIGIEAFNNCSIVKVTLPSSVTKISEEAFYSSQKQELEINFEDLIHLKQIGERAFYRRSFQFLDLSNLFELAVIGYQAFSSCSTGNEIIDLSNSKKLSSVGSWGLYFSTGDLKIIVPDDTLIRYEANAVPAKTSFYSYGITNPGIPSSCRWYGFPNIDIENGQTIYNGFELTFAYDEIDIIIDDGEIRHPAEDGTFVIDQLSDGRHTMKAINAAGIYDEVYFDISSDVKSLNVRTGTKNIADKFIETNQFDLSDTMYIYITPNVTQSNGESNMLSLAGLTQGQVALYYNGEQITDSIDAPIGKTVELEYSFDMMGIKPGDPVSDLEVRYQGNGEVICAPLSISLSKGSYYIFTSLDFSKPYPVTGDPVEFTLDDFRLMSMVNYRTVEFPQGSKLAYYTVDSNGDTLEEPLTEAPRLPGEYKVEITIPETDFYESKISEYSLVLQAQPAIITVKDEFVVGNDYNFKQIQYTGESLDLYDYFELGEGAEDIDFIGGYYVPEFNGDTGNLGVEDLIPITTSPETMETGLYEIYGVAVPDQYHRQNYQSRASVCVWVVQAGNQWTEELSMESWTVGDLEKEPKAASKFGTVRYEYYNAQGEKINKPSDPGKYSVKAIVDETKNYKGMVSSATFEIKGLFTSSYAFVPADSNQTLPDEVQALLPIDTNNYPLGSQVIARQLNEQQVDVGNGVWVFNGWDKEKEENIQANVMFTGTWSYYEKQVIAGEDLIAYEGGLGSDHSMTTADALPKPQWKAQFENKTVTVGKEKWDIETKGLPFAWEYRDADGNKVEKSATTGIYGLYVFPLQGYENQPVIINNKILVLPEEGMKISQVYVRDVTDNNDADELSIDTFKNVYNHASPILRENRLKTGTYRSIGAMLNHDSALMGDYNENGTHDNTCENEIVHVHVADGTQFYKNGKTNMPVNENAKIGLLWDDVIEEAMEKHAGTLHEKAMASIERESAGLFDEEKEVNRCFKYIDLVDMNDGNIWVGTAKESATVYVPYPEGIDEYDKIAVVLFSELTRDYTIENDEEELAAAIDTSTGMTLEVVKSEEGILFEIPSQSFGVIESLWQEETKTEGQNEMPAEETHSKQPKKDTGLGNDTVTWSVIAGAAFLTSAGMFCKKKKRAYK